MSIAASGLEIGRAVYSFLRSLFFSRSLFHIKYYVYAYLLHISDLGSLHYFSWEKGELLFSSHLSLSLLLSSCYAAVAARKKKKKEKKKK